MKTLGVLAGPNGAGKSTYAELLFKSKFLPTLPINLDVLEQFIDESKIPYDMLRYGVEKEKQLEKLFYEYAYKAIKNKKDFSYENNLSYPQQLHPIKPFADAGYHIKIVYICLDNIEHSKERVSKRISEGGHRVNDDKLIENFNRGLANLDEIFKDVQEVIVLENNQESGELLFCFSVLNGNLNEYLSTPKCFSKKQTPKLMALIKNRI